MGPAFQTVPARAASEFGCGRGRAELAAVETYDQALEKADHAISQSILRHNRGCHAERVDMLTGQIRELGGTPADGSGAWGAFAQAIQGGAKLFGESTAVAALEEGEDHGLANYCKDLSALSPGAQTLVRSKLLPAQERTHDQARRLKTILD